MPSPAESTESGVEGCGSLCPEEPPRGQASPPTCCPLKMAPDWLPGRVAQSSVHHTTSSHRHRQEGKGKKPHLLHTYYVLCPGYPPHPREDPEKRESLTHIRKRHWAGDLTAGATCLVCDRYGIKPHSLGAASNSSLLQPYRCKHLTTEGSQTWFELTWLSFKSNYKYWDFTIT